MRKVYVFLLERFAGGLYVFRDLSLGPALSIEARSPIREQPCGRCWCVLESSGQFLQKTVRLLAPACIAKALAQDRAGREQTDAPLFCDCSILIGFA